MPITLSMKSKETVAACLRTLADHVDKGVAEHEWSVNSQFRGPRLDMITHEIKLVFYDSNAADLPLERSGGD
jgi:hypothetical protein